MLKVLKFGGSSMADAHQFAKVKAIVDSDPSRRVVVVSAAGKRSRDDHKLTDLLYLCYAHLQYGVSCDAVFDGTSCTCPHRWRRSSPPCGRKWTVASVRTSW